MSKLMISLLAAAGIAFAGASNAADNKGMSRDAYKAEKDKIESQYKVDKDHCGSMSGNAKDVCQKEAKGKERLPRPSSRRTTRILTRRAPMSSRPRPTRNTTLRRKSATTCQAIRKTFA